MPSNEQRRQAAKRKLERQLERRAQRAKRRRTIGVSATVLGTVLVVGLVYFLATMGGGDDEQTASDATDPATSGEPEMPEAVTTEGPCAYIEAEQPPVDGLPEVGMPEDPDPTPSEGTVSVTLGTNEGEIPLTLDREQAPCTVQSFLHLAESGYFDASPCHRLVDSTDALEVLQCGDPSGTGMGGPGYNVPDEIDPEQTYPRGTLAMAN
ncbi:peptidylprolyl isomerase, partial [Actinoalloteichus caeruleus]